MTETQQSCSAWARETFGGRPEATVARVAARANEEMAELLTIATSKAPYRGLAYEAADVVIVLYHLAGIAGFDLHKAIDEKMEINRKRKWTSNGDGVGYHVPSGGKDG